MFFTFMRSYLLCVVLTFTHAQVNTFIMTALHTKSYPPRVVLPTVYFTFILIPTRRFRGFIVYYIYHNDHCKVQRILLEKKLKHYICRVDVSVVGVH